MILRQNRLKYRIVPFPEYRKYIYRKRLFIATLVMVCLVSFFSSVSIGTVTIPYSEVIKTLLGLSGSPRFQNIITNIRLPNALAALIAGSGLAISGAVMQSVIRNPLGSPFTLGISQAGAFGAAVAIIFAGSGVMQSTQAGAITVTNPFITIGWAFFMCVLSALIIVLIAKFYSTNPEVIVLCGVALGAAFSAGTMFLQYFADDVQLAAIVFWSFGDVGRADWTEVSIMAIVVVPGTLFFILNRWNYNAIEAGDETARGLGVRVEWVRILGMIVASLITAVIVSFLGIIAFVGLISPHMVRRFVGDDYRFVIPASCLSGAALLLVSDIAARIMLKPHVLPVAVLTSFIGAPLFLYLLLSKRIK
ncbi:MAG: iron ABC transporter permease [Prolixibacteraceae bacterium]|nr:iron ABC transporter permease [Prolixibacteraceae bacterium]